MAFDPSNIDLQYIYADQFNQRQDTSVYGNGAMQVSIFVSVNYNGVETESTESEVKKYVQENAVIYSLTESKDVDWTKSTEENEFEHDINHASDEASSSQDNKPGAKILTDVRVPLYFTVPRGKTGEYRWIAKLDGKETSSSSPVTIEVSRFTIEATDFDIQKMDDKGCAHFRCLRYKPDVFAPPAAQRLVKPVEPLKGIKFEGANCWVSMMMSSKGHKAGCFVEYKNLSLQVAKNKYIYKPGTYETTLDVLHIQPTKEPTWTSATGWEDSELFTEDYVKEAWSWGIPMLLISHDDLELTTNSAFGWVRLDFEEQEFHLQDNFGNLMRMNFNWDVDEWWGLWGVSDVAVENN